MGMYMEGNVVESLCRHCRPMIQVNLKPFSTFSLSLKLQVYARHFGWQMQHRLQAVLKENYNGELPVGQAAIIKTLSANETKKKFENPKFNEGKLIKYLISAPTMRVPLNVTDTVNAYLAFRAVIIAGKYSL